MMPLRRLLSLILCLSLAAPMEGFAVLKSRTPETMLALVDEYVQETLSEQPGPIHLGAGRAAWLAKNVVGQVITLSPEDFNMFLFYTVERYIKDAKHRPQIYLLLKQIHDAIKADLDNTKQLKEGPYHEMVKGSYSYLTWIIVLYVGFRFKAAHTMRGREFLMEIEKREMAIGKNKYYRSAYNVASNPVVWGGLAGAGIGYVNYLRELDKVRRSDPLEILKVVQANLACDLSYRGLEVEQEWLKIKDEPNAIGVLGPKLQEKARNLMAESAVLSKQYKRLQSLDTKERLFQQTLKELPENWAQFRKSLTEAEESKDGQCRQMSLIHLKLELEKIDTAITKDMPEKPAVLQGGENIDPKLKPVPKPAQKDDSDFQRHLGGEMVNEPEVTPPAQKEQKVPAVSAPVEDEDNDELMDAPRKEDE